MVSTIVLVDLMWAIVSPHPGMGYKFGQARISGRLRRPTRDRYVKEALSPTSAQLHLREATRSPLQGAPGACLSATSPIGASIALLACSPGHSRQVSFVEDPSLSRVSERSTGNMYCNEDRRGPWQESCSQTTRDTCVEWSQREEESERWSLFLSFPSPTTAESSIGTESSKLRNGVGLEFHARTSENHSPLRLPRQGFQR